MKIAVPLAVLLAGIGLILAKKAMMPNPDAGVLFTLLCLGAAALAGLVCWGLIRTHRRLPTLRWTIPLVALAAVGVAGSVVAALAVAMLLSPSDLQLVIAALLLGTGLGALVAVGVTGPLTADLRELAVASRRVADGDLEVRTDIDRRDEVGELARSLDRMVDQLASLETERAQAEAARQRLLAAIGHDLRTPLASLRAAIEAIQDGVATDPDRYLRAMAADVDLLRSMVDDLFVLTRLETGDLRLDFMSLDLSEVVDGSVEAAATIGRARDVGVRLTGDGAALVVGDPQALHRVLRNLLDNALQHAPQGSTVHVELSTADGAASVRVRDDGPGFPPEFVERAFDHFSRADAARERRRGGAGLGLAIAKELVETHRGEIWIEPGAGGTIAFSVPLAAPAPPAPAARATVAPAPARPARIGDRTLPPADAEPDRPGRTAAQRQPSP